MNKEQKKNYIKNITEQFENSESVLVTHYQGLNMKQLDDLRKQMREHGIQFKITKNRITKLALQQTRCKDLVNLFSGPTAIAYSQDPVTPAKVAVSFEKKLENFKIVGGGYDGEKIDLTKINFLATLPSIDELRGKLIGLILAPAQKIASVVKEPGGQLARLINAQSKNLEETK